MPILAGLLAMALGAAAQTPPPLLSPIFTDHMVMQRAKKNTFWGWAPPGTKVRVSVSGKSGQGTADASGKWTARVDPPAVGGPYTLAVDGPQHLELHDVMVGDVWICSGQSNMEMGISLTDNAAGDIASSADPGLRLYMVPHATAFDPVKVNAGAWAQCDPTSIANGGWGGFSAVGYHFGKELRRRLGVPIGLVETSWGGTIAEAWTSRPSVERFGDFKSSLDMIDQLKRQPALPYPTMVDNWLKKNDPGVRERWQDSAEGWKPIQMPKPYEEIGLRDFDGTVWFRKELQLGETPTGVATLTLGAIDDIDVTFVNGVAVGSGYVYNADRVYNIPAGTLHQGKNVITVLTLDTGGGGGFTSDVDHLKLEYPASVDIGGRVSLPLAGEWGYRIGADLKKTEAAPRPINDNPNIPTVLYNGMVAPIVPLAIKGAIWYQGESNADRAYQYRRLLPTMIADWRRSFGQGDFPFYIVSLANYMAKKDVPGDDAWAELRESQAMTARNVKNSGLAVTIDVGDPNDIHPKDKRTVGYRLALNALHGVYGEDVVYSGPTYRSMSVENGTIRLRFDHAEGGLAAKGGKLPAFAIAGADRKWVWADARIDGDTVVVSSPKVAQPVAVRYAWESNPVATLVNGAGLPAVPFRTDDWAGMTFGKK